MKYHSGRVTFASVLVVLLASHLLVGTVAAQDAYFTGASRSEDPLRLPFGYLESPIIGDFNGDARNDLLLGSEGGLLFAAGVGGEFEAPVYRGGVTARNGAGIDVNGDGLIDLVSPFSFRESSVGYAEQTQEGYFVPKTATVLHGLMPEGRGGVASGDINNDGLIELVVGTEGDGVGSTPGPGMLGVVQRNDAGAFVRLEGADNPFDGLLFPNGYQPSPSLGDVDADGDLDLVVSCLRTQYCQGMPHRFFEHMDDGSFVERFGSENPFQTIEFVGYRLALFDHDGDGDLDVISSSVGAGLTYFERTPEGFVSHDSPGSLLGGYPFISQSNIAFGDLDGDGDLDVVSAPNNGNPGLDVYRRVGGAPEAYQHLEGTLSPLHWVSGPSMRPILSDVDNDGDTDLVIVDHGVPNVRYLENVDTNIFVERVGSDNPFSDVDGVGFGALGDVDGDGRADLVAAGSRDDNYNFRYFVRSGTDRYREAFGEENPFVGLSNYGACLGDGSPRHTTGTKPILADIDGDGDTDLVSGRCFFQQLNGGFVPVLNDSANPFSELPAPSRYPDVGSHVQAFEDLNGDGIGDVVLKWDWGGAPGYRTFFGTALPVSVEPIPDEFEALHVTVFPNPASHRVSVSLIPSSPGPIRIVLYDVLGRELLLVHSGWVDAGKKLEASADLSTLASGAYLLRIEGDSFAGNRKLSVVR